MLKTASSSSSSSSAAQPSPLIPSMGGTGTVATSDIGAVFFAGNEGIHQTDPNFTYNFNIGELANNGGLNSALHSRLASNFAVTSNATLANISASGSALSVNVAAGITYTFRAVLFTTSNSSGGVQAAIAGTATATSVVYEAIVHDGAAVKAQTRATALATAVGGVTAVSAALIVIEGTITVNAAGTLTVQFAQNASNASASTVLAGSSFILDPVS